MNCPKCNNPVEAGAKFCEHCGERIPEVAAATAAPATVFCTNCGTKTNANVAFCENCGARIEAAVPTAAPVAPPKPKKPRKKLSKKTWTLIGIGAAVLALLIAAIVIVAILVGNANRKNYAMYMKDHQLIFAALGKDEKFKVTQNLGEDIDEDDLAKSGNALAYYVRMADDNQRLFFVDKIESGYNTEATLCYKDIYDKDAKVHELCKISLGSAYAVNKDGTKVVYCYDEVLYVHNLKEATEIDAEVEWWKVDKDCTRVVYYTADGDLYEKVLGKEKEKIDSGISQVYHVSADAKELVYTKDGNLYIKKSGNDKEKLVSDVYEIIAVYGTDAIYYVLRSEEEVHISDYVDDPYAETDAIMTRPIEPNKPSEPFQGLYPSEQEYLNAMAKYEQDLAEYEKLMAEHATKLQEYYNRNDRENIRDRMDSYDFEMITYTLYYYDGKVGSQVAIGWDNGSNYTTALDKAVITFKAATIGKIEKTNINDVESLYTFSSNLRSAMKGTSNWAIAVGKNVTSLAEYDIYDTEIRVSDAGKSAYFLAEVEDGKGKLYRIDIADDKAAAPVEYDTAVSTCRHVYVGDDRFIYFKEYNSSDYTGDLYTDKTKVDSEVYIYGVFCNENDDSLLYFINWNDEKEYGTFKQYADGKTVKIKDDVSTFGYTSKGEILYLYDYSLNSYSGDLYLFSEGKSKKLDTDVNAILSMQNLAG